MPEAAEADLARLGAAVGPVEEAPLAPDVHLDRARRPSSRAQPARPARVARRPSQPLLLPVGRTHVRPPAAPRVDAGQRRPGASQPTLSTACPFVKTVFRLMRQRATIATCRTRDGDLAVARARARDPLRVRLRPAADRRQRALARAVAEPQHRAPLHRDARPARLPAAGPRLEALPARPKVLDLGFSAINSMDVREISAPHLRRLSTRRATRSTSRSSTASTSSTSSAAARRSRGSARSTSTSTSARDCPRTAPRWARRSSPSSPRTGARS